jgi:DNA polymerase-3 subunit beta
VKVRVERDALSDAVSWVARELPTRPVVPVLAGLLLRADEDGLQLSCFDYEVSARARVPAEVGEPGSALVPGRLLAEIARSLPWAQVEVGTAADLVTVTCGSAEFALVSLPQTDYPQLPELPRVTGTIDGGLLAAAAAQVVPAASRDDTLPMLTGVYLDVDGTVLTLAATDRYRMAVRRLGWEPADRSARFSALVPARTLADVTRTAGPGQPVTIALGSAGHTGAGPADGMISFEGAGRRLTARLISADFIKYEARFPDSFEACAELPAGQFTEAVRRVSLVADRGAPVQLTFRRDVVVVEAQSDGRARAVETVPVALAGTDQSLSFNPHYLLDGLAAAALTPPGGDASGRIRLQFTSPAKPALITWIAGDDTVHNDPDGANSSAGNGVARPGASLPASGGEGTPGFRYLVVPLRAPSAAA